MDFSKKEKTKKNYFKKIYYLFKSSNALLNYDAFKIIRLYLLFIILSINIEFLKH